MSLPRTHAGMETEHFGCNTPPGNSMSTTFGKLPFSLDIVRHEHDEL